jgi:hypothetical protein
MGQSVREFLGDHPGNDRRLQAWARGELAQTAKYAKWDGFLSEVGRGRCGEGVVSCWNVTVFDGVDDEADE